MILVVGGTGRLGREMVTRLSASGREVRVLTRDPARAQGLPADVAIGDVRDASSLGDALRGATVVVSAAHGFLGGRGDGPDEVDDRGTSNLVRAALEEDVQHFVLLSVLDAGPNHPMLLHRAKYAAEQHLVTSGLPWTILRPSAYIETWVDVIGAKIPSGGPAIVFGRADNPINFVSVQDVATIAQRALSDSALRSQIIDIPGQENLTMTQLAQHLGAGKIRRIPRPALRLLSAVVAPWAPAFARQTGAALVMDTTDMSANPTAHANRFPDITRHPATDIADAFQANMAGTVGT